MNQRNEMQGDLFTRVRSEADLGPCPRRWNGNDQTDRNHHGLVPIAEEPFEIVLNWKKSPQHPTRPVGCFRLNLHNLCQEGYISRPRAGNVRLRFYHDPDGCVYIEVRPGKPRLLVGKVE